MARDECTRKPHHRRAGNDQMHLSAMRPMCVPRLTTLDQPLAVDVTATLR